MSVFTLPAEMYTRDLDFIPQAKLQAAFYLSRKTKTTIQQALSYLDRVLGPGGKFELKDPQTLVLVREKYEDKEKQVMPFSNFINKIKERKAITVPTLCCYIHPDEKQSILGQYVEGNIQLRAQDKKEQFAAERAGNMDLYNIKFNSQTSRKLNNNALSGAHAAKSTPLHNKSSHSSLTSTCRTITSYGNANNETVIAGNRHLWSPEIAKVSIISRCTLVDLELMTIVMDKYNLHYPTIDEVMATITYSTDLYWHNEHETLKIRELVAALTAVERASVVYTSDLWHLGIYNKEFIVNFIAELGKRINDPEYPDTDATISNIDGDIIAFVSLLCEEQLIEEATVTFSSSLDDCTYVIDSINLERNDNHWRSMPCTVVSGTGVGQHLTVKASSASTVQFSDAPSIPLDTTSVCVIKKGSNIKDLKTAGHTARYNNVGATVNNINNTLNRYSDFIKCFFVTKVVPPSIYNVPSMVRRCVTTSDTDSTIFTTQEWIQMITGSYVINKQARAISATIAYLSSQTIQHVLAIVSGNMGVPDKHKFRLAMKNEYLFPVSALTNRAKHYFALQGAQEGNVKPHMELEIKGVELRSSKVPIHVNRKLQQLIEFVLMGVHDNGHISLFDVLDEIALLELNILESLRQSDYSYMLTAQIKDPSSYVDEEDANAYQHYKMYNSIFSHKYGEIAPPPYLGIKIPINLPNKTAIKNWLANIVDVDVKRRAEEWIVTTGKTNVTNLIFPESVLSSHGIPAELINVINIRQMMFETLSGFYLVLESLGLYMKDDNITKLVSDTYKPRITKSKFD